MVDYAAGLDLAKPFERFEQAKQAMRNLLPGITHFIIHPSKETPELISITPDWQSRVADYQTFMDENLKQYIVNEGIQVIGYRKLRNLFPL